MDGTLLRFFVHRTKTHKGIPLYEWLLMEAKKLGLPGGSALTTIASFGHHGRMHEDHFYELGGDMTIEILFAATETQSRELLLLLKEEKLNLFYIKSTAEFGFLQEELP